MKNKKSKKTKETSKDGEEGVIRHIGDSSGQEGELEVGPEILAGAVPSHVQWIVEAVLIVM